MADKRGRGRPSRFQDTVTRTIRVPVYLAEKLLNIAEALDRGDQSALNQEVEIDATKSEGLPTAR